MFEFSKIPEGILSEQAAKAIPLCVTLIYKHREIETLMWELIATLASRLRPSDLRSVVNVGGPITPYVCVKHGENLRTVFDRHERFTLLHAISDETVVLPRVLATLIGDPGVDGDGFVHLIIGRDYYGHMKLRRCWREIEQARFAR